MQNINFDREKYIRIAKAEGVDAAITQLHLDTEKWEIEAFEGKEGYKPQTWQEIIDVRKFSRELWEIALVTGKN